VFIDRDGVINYNRDDYVKSWEEFEFIPGSIEAIKKINRTARLLIVITNQSPIGRGIFDTETLDSIHMKMLHELSKAGARIDAIFYCPHSPNDNCDCRKPKPGLILRAAKEFNIDLSDSWMVGDSKSDMKAGEEAGCRTIQVTIEKPLSQIVEQIFDEL
jgi:histidinol-phosphate phosphatase family protein